MKLTVRWSDAIMLGAPFVVVLGLGLSNAAASWPWVAVTIAWAMTLALQVGYAAGIRFSVDVMKNGVPK